MLNGLETVHHYETHQKMSIDMDSESANVVLAMNSIWIY